MVRTLMCTCQNCLVGQSPCLNPEYYEKWTQHCVGKKTTKLKRKNFWPLCGQLANDGMSDGQRSFAKETDLTCDDNMESLHSAHEEQCAAMEDFDVYSQNEMRSTSPQVSDVPKITVTVTEHERLAKGTKHNFQNSESCKPRISRICLVRVSLPVCLW